MALESTDDGLHSVAHVNSLVGADGLHDAVIALSAAHVCRGLEVELVQVEACAEGFALAGENDYAAFGVHTDLLQIVVEVGHLLVRHCIQVSSIVEGNNVDRATDVNLEALILILEFGQLVCLLIYAHAHFPFHIGNLV